MQLCLTGFQLQPELSCWDVQVQDGKQAQYDAFYRLSNTEQQITSYVFDVSATWHLRLYAPYMRPT